MITWFTLLIQIQILNDKTMLYKIMLKYTSPIRYKWNTVERTDTTQNNVNNFLVYSLSCMWSVIKLVLGSEVRRHSCIWSGRYLPENSLMTPTRWNGQSLNPWRNSKQMLRSVCSNDGPHHAQTCLCAYADSEGPDQPAHPRSLIWTFTVRKQNCLILKNV